MRFALFMCMAIPTVAQPTVEIHHVIGSAPSGLTETERWWRTAQAVKWRNIRTPEERDLVTATTAVYRKMFQPELGPEPKVVTLTDKGQDILVARWTRRNASDTFSELIVWDTPNQTAFIFRLPPGSWPDDAQIRSRFEQLLLPPVSEWQTLPARGVTMNVARDPRNGRWIGNGVFLEFVLRQYDLGPSIWFNLWESAEGSYLAVSFREGASWPKNMRGIAERFPPLEARLGGWSKERILAEISNGGFSEDRRDRTLARELLKREVTEDELLAVLKRRVRDPIGTLLSLIVEERQVARFAGAIQKYLQDDRGCGKCNEAFNIVGRSNEVDFTDVALNVVRRDQDSTSPRIASSFFYVTTHGSAADYRALLELPSSHRFGHKYSLEAMRLRLGLAEDGNPKPTK